MSRACALLCLSALVFCSVAGCAERAKPLAQASSSPLLPESKTELKELFCRLDDLPPAEQKSQLQIICAQAKDSDSKAKAFYLLGRILQKMGSNPDLLQAIDCFEKARQIEPLAERCQWHISQAAESLGDEKTGRAALNDIIAKSPDKETILAARYHLGQSYRREAETEKARQEFALIEKEAPQSQFALGSAYYLAQMDIEEGRQDKAINSLRRYLQESPDGRFAREIVEQLLQLKEFTPCRLDRELFASVYFARGQWLDALKQWQEAGYDTRKAAGQIWSSQATCLLNLGRTEEARKLLLEGIKAHAGDDSVVPAATIVCRMLKREGAIAVWKAVLNENPAHADAALYNLAIRAPAGEALSYYLRIARNYPGSAYAPEANWWLIWDQIEKGKLTNALASLKRARSQYPLSKAVPRYLYWIGKIHERLKQKDQAKAAYLNAINSWGWHYYGHRAKSRLAALSGKKDCLWATCPDNKLKEENNTAKDWSWPFPPAKLVAQAGATIAVLSELGQWDECLDLLPARENLQLKAFFLARLNRPLDAINAAGSQLKGKPGKDESSQIAYPLLYHRQIARQASSRKIDPFLVQALIREESRYDVQALSSSRAIGLMQLLPGTALGVAKRLAVPIHSTADIFQPENNLKLGIDYLGYVLARFKGNALFAVASYNGGPNAVRRWAAHMPADQDSFVENIPFAETRDYVRKVFGSYWNYQEVYKP